MSKNKKFAAIAGISFLAALGIIQILNLTIAEVSHLHRVYFDWEEIKAISATTITFPQKNASSTANLTKNATSSAGTIREITMFTSRVSETDGDPCTAAWGENICKMDFNVCATNAFPHNTKLFVAGLGECVVKDKMNSRYTSRVDWYAKMDFNRAITFGKQNLLVSVIK